MTKTTLPADVIRLVIAAREAAYGGVLDDLEIRNELDAACEAFADRVPWEDDPNDK